MRRLLSRTLGLVVTLIFAGAPVTADGAEQFPVSSIPTVMSSFGQAYSAQRQLLYNVSSYNVIAVIDVENDRFLRAIDLSSSGAILCSGMALANDKLYVESYRKIIVVDLASESVTKVIDQPFYLGSTYGDVVADASGRRVYTIIGSTSHITVIDTRNDAVLGRIEVGPDYNDLALSPDGSTLYATNKETSRLAVLDTESLSVERIVPIATGSNFLDFPSLMTVAPDGRLYVSYAERDYRSHLAVFSPEGNRIATHALTGFSTGVAISPGGDFLVTGGGDILSADTGRLITHLPINPNGLSQVFFPLDDHRAFVTNMNSRYVNVVGGFDPRLSLDGPASPRPGETLTLHLNVPDDAGRPYVVCASLGHENGVPLPNGRRFPLDVDALFRRSRDEENQEFRQFSGTLSPSGTGTASVVLSPSLVAGMGPGTTIYLAFATFSENPVTRENVRSISNVIAVTLSR